VLALREGKTYEQLLTDRIAKPLGLADTSVMLNDSQRQRLAPPYNAALNHEKNWDLPTLVGAGGIRSTGRDLLAFAQANLAADENKADDKPLAKAMRLSHEERHKMEDGLAIGLAWHIARDGVTRWHNGMTGGYHSWVAFVPGKNVATMVLANTATGKITELGEQITRVACGEEIEPPKERKQIDVEEAVLETYVGSYALSPQFVLTVALENGQLMVQATGQQKFPVFAESKTDFFYKVVDAQITFKSDENGKVEKLVLHQNGRDMEATRQK
jgi:D-alanyl-D-alanine-carboxypeptidase/D-alanyl-D-alanine-endopeptidase